MGMLAGWSNRGDEEVAKNCSAAIAKEKEDCSEDTSKIYGCLMCRESCTILFFERESDAF
jgi:hypothetical protein